MDMRKGVALGLAIFMVCAGTASAQPSSIGSEPAGPPPRDWTFDIGPRRVPFYAFGPHKIWGATAMVLSEFLEILRSIDGLRSHLPASPDKEQLPS